MATENITTLDIINAAIVAANYEAHEVMNKGTRESNGSEAWQAVKIEVDGRSKVAKELIANGVKKDFYYGYIVSAIDMDANLQNYYAEEAWTTEFARVLNVFGIKARRIKRLL